MVHKEQVRLEDGRHAERIVREEVNEAGEAVVVTELHVEPKRTLQLNQRVVERKRPVIYEREIETIDEHGEVVDRQIESLDPESKMRVVDHIATHSDISAQNVDETKGYITREDMSMFAESLKDFARELNDKSCVTEEADEVSSYSVLTEKVSEQEASSGIDSVTMGLFVVIAAMGGVLAYINFWM